MWVTDGGTGLINLENITQIYSLPERRYEKGGTGPGKMVWVVKMYDTAGSQISTEYVFNTPEEADKEMTKMVNGD